MRPQALRVILSATDLSNFLNCRHLTGLDLSVARGARKRPHFDDPLVELLFDRGLAHEKAYVDALAAEGRSIADLRDHRTSREDTIARTVQAMRDGADAIVQGALGDDHWFGYPDVLLRRDDRPSRLGPWSYEVVDTKLARSTRAGMVLQLCLYTELLGAAQGAVPERFFIVTPDATHPFRFEDYAAYFRLVQRQLLATVARDAEAVMAEHYPEPVEHCEVCAWSGRVRQEAPRRRPPLPRRRGLPGPAPRARGPGRRDPHRRGRAAAPDRLQAETGLQGVVRPAPGAGPGPARVARADAPGPRAHPLPSPASASAACRRPPRATSSSTWRATSSPARAAASTCSGW